MTSERREGVLELAWGGPRGLLATSETPLSDTDGDKIGITPTGSVLEARAGEALTDIPLPLTDFFSFL